MRARSVVAACLLVAAGSTPAPAAESTIETDRPDVSNSTRTVPAGAVQVESGLEYARSSFAGTDGDRRLAVQVTLRTGLTDRFEVELGGEPLVRLRGREEATDHGDLTLGFKYRFLDARGWMPSLGLEPSVKLAVADAPVGTERPDFAIVGLASFDLPWRLGLDVNAGPALIGQTRPNGYLVQALASGSLSREVAEGLSAFGEVFFASRAERGGRDVVGFDTGVVYVLASPVALDAAVETSLKGPGRDWAVRAGVSARFGR